MLKASKILNIFLVMTAIPTLAHQKKAYKEGQTSFSRVDLSSFATQDLTKSADTIGYKSTKVLGELNEGNIEKTARAKKGSAFDRGNTFGDFLVDSSARAESQKVAEKDEISSMAGTAQKVGDDPQKHFKVCDVQRKRTKKTTRVLKTCLVSSDFELKTKISLRYSAPDRTEKETVLTLYYPEYLKKVGARNDEIGPLSTKTKSHQVDIERFRKHACPHFEPIDFVTKKVHKINCKRIQNFSLEGVVDEERDDIVDRYGDHRNPVRLIKIRYKHDTYQGGEGLKDTCWSFKTDDMSEKITKYNCALKRDVCLDKAPRKIEELEIKQPCWERELTYDCGQHINTCSEVEGKGCEPKSKKCLERINGVCALWEKTYNCVETTIVTQNISSDGDLPFCWSGNCHELHQKDDEDFGEVAAKLGMLQDMQKNLDMDGDKVIGVFKGKEIGCNRHMLNFKDCCGSCKGWGKSLGLGTCSSEEKTLAKRRQKGQCRYIGKYCAEKVPLTGICLREKSVFCCFESKMARVFQEKGRDYLGIGWGTPKCPDCRAFTVEEMQQIKWDALDFREVFSDATLTIKTGKGKKKFSNKMPKIQGKAEERRHGLTA